MGVSNQLHEAGWPLAPVRTFWRREKSLAFSEIRTPDPLAVAHADNTTPATCGYMGKLFLCSGVRVLASEIISSVKSKEHKRVTEKVLQFMPLEISNMFCPAQFHMKGIGL